jgi:hypothetical protein
MGRAEGRAGGITREPRFPFSPRTRTLPSILARLEPPKPALGTSTSRHDTRRRGGGHGNEGQSNDARTRPSRCAVPPLAQPERPALITIL